MIYDGLTVEVIRLPGLLLPDLLYRDQKVQSPDRRFPDPAYRALLWWGRRLAFQPVLYAPRLPGLCRIPLSLHCLCPAPGAA